MTDLETDDMTGQAPPKIEFPCRYPIKTMGFATPGFSEDVLAICQRHAPEAGAGDVTVRPSSKGNYIAVTVVIEATGPEQLKNLFADLKTLESVKLVL